MAGSTPRRRTERAMMMRSGPALNQFDPDRQCAHPACQARLSRYNPNRTCAAHGGWQESPVKART